MNKYKVKMLVVGNGFDLVHKLPTQYVDFLGFCKELISNTEIKYLEDKLDCCVNEDYIRTLLERINFSEEKTNIAPDNIRNISRLICGNIWYYYIVSLYDDKIIRGENWIDFESEISSVVSYLDNLNVDLDEGVAAEISLYTTKMQNVSRKVQKLKLFWNIITCFVAPIETATFKKVRKTLISAMNMLALALDYYLSCFVEGIEVKSNKFFENNLYDALVSFNYTHTYQRLYAEPRELFYIHGQCNGISQESRSGLVIGIDEYLSEDRINSFTNYNIFKKYVQRVQTGTYKEVNRLYRYIEEHQMGNQLYNGVISGKGAFDNEFEIHFFGHSLDVTDKDVLKRIFEARAIFKIYCKDKDSEADYIANLCKIIGQKELLARLENESLSFEYLQ